MEKSVQVEFPFELPSSSCNTCAAPMQSSSLPSRPSFTADLQPVLVGAALSYDIVDGVIDQVVHSAMELAAVAHVTKLASPVTGPCMPLSEEDEWIDNMLDNITKLEEKYGAMSKSVCDDRLIFSAEVAIPAFVKAKSLSCIWLFGGSHVLHRMRRKVREPAMRRQTLGCKPRFDVPSPFASIPGFKTNLDIIAILQAPIGGFIYKGGAGDNTTWQLYADAVFIWPRLSSGSLYPMHYIPNSFGRCFCLFYAGEEMEKFCLPTPSSFLIAPPRLSMHARSRP